MADKTRRNLRQLMVELQTHYGYTEEEAWIIADYILRLRFQKW
jgi:hypothetical protein